MLDAAVVVNLVITVAYLIISGLIIRGLLDAGQLGRRNPLGTATAGIFGSCGLGHLVHAEHLVMGAATVDWHLLAVDAGTAAIALTYLSLRRSFPSLLRQTALFPDTLQTEAVEQVLADERLFRAAFDEAPIGMTMVDLDGTYLQVNAAFAALIGCTPGELIGRRYQAVTLEEDVAAGQRLRADLLAGRIASYRVETRYVRVDGTTVPALLSVSLVRNVDGTPRHTVGQIIDRTALLEASAAADAAQVRFSAIFDASPIGKAVIARDGTVERVNPAFAVLVGPAVQGRPVAELFDAADAADVRRALVEGGPVDAVPLGSDRILEVHAAPLPGNTQSVIVQVLDVTEERAQEEVLRELADHDPLTGLLNRRRLDEEVTAALAESARTGRPGALLLLDMDGFKLINDTLGHAAGDDLIRSSALVLRGLVRRTDTAARLGGDEFAVLLRDTALPQAIAVADAIAAGLHHRVTTPQGPAPVSASLGIAPFGGEEGLTCDELLARADAAMYDAKRAGGDRSAVYDPTSGTREGMSHRRHWTARLRDAVLDDRLALVAQPIVGLQDHADGRRWFELLLRYREPDGSLTGPGAFLPVAEETDLVIALDRWVLEQAMAAMDRIPDLRLAVNVSTRTFADPALPAHLRAIGADRLPAGSLALELTETAALARTDAVERNARWIREQGMVLALDDFGSGFATFSHLRALPVDLLKIDGSFVARLPHSQTDQRIIESIVGLAEGLSLGVVAEHVESDDALAWLRRVGIGHGQGNLLGRPRPLEDLLGAPVT